MKSAEAELERLSNFILEEATSEEYRYDHLPLHEVVDLTIKVAVNRDNALKGLTALLALMSATILEMEQETGQPSGIDGRPRIVIEELAKKVMCDDYTLDRMMDGVVHIFGESELVEIFQKAEKTP